MRPTKRPPIGNSYNNIPNSTSSHIPDNRNDTSSVRVK
jgi:hypothetical protein